MKSSSISNKTLPKDFKIVHVLPDGTRVDSIKGMFIPYTQETNVIYELIEKYAH